MKRKLNTVLSALLAIQCIGQNTFTLSGKIFDSKTGEPLPFATIGVQGSPHGTVSNSEGAFTFFLPYTYANDTLSISYVGYEVFKTTIQEVIQRGVLDVSLKEKIIILDEVEVNSEQLTGKQILQRALGKLRENFHSDPFIMKGFFRDIRNQNGETVYLVEAALDVQDPGFSVSSGRSRKFYLKGVRASDSRIHELIMTSLLNSGNALSVNLENNFWLNSIRHRVRINDFVIEDIISKNDELFYSITLTETVSKGDLAEHHEDLKYTLIHRYLVHCETYAIHKVEHLEYPIEGTYVGIEPPYPGDTLFYSKKGWNMVIEFDEYEGEMYLKYHDVNYTFDIVDEKNDEIFLEMSYQFTFIATDLKTGKPLNPVGIKMNGKKPLAIQGEKYDAAFWDDPGNAKLVPLTKKQLNDLEKDRPLEEQFRSRKTRLKKNAG